jgi:hypothetical protein
MQDGDKLSIYDDADWFSSQWSSAGAIDGSLEALLGFADKYLVIELIAGFFFGDGTGVTCSSSTTAG